jgi:hypothetical protein
MIFTKLVVSSLSFKTMLLNTKILWHAAAEDLFNLHTVEPPKLVARR